MPSSEANVKTGHSTRYLRHRKHRWTLGFAAAGALAIAVHLGLGGALMTNWPWTGLAADLILALVLLKLVLVIVIALRHRAKRRSRASIAPAPAGPVVRSEARVPTSKAERYAKQLCSHASWKASHAEWAAPDGMIEFPDDMGICRITAEPDHLVLAVEATDPANLARMQRIISANVERFASRDGITVDWVEG